MYYKLIEVMLFGDELNGIKLNWFWIVFAKTDVKRVFSQKVIVFQQ